MIQISETNMSGMRLHINMPDPELISNAKVRKAVEYAIETHAALQGAKRTVVAADADVLRAENALASQAADAVIESGKMPKGLRKAVRDAEDALLDARDEVTARTTAFADAHNKLIAVIEANADEWRKATLKEAERALNLLAAARKSLEVADREADAAFGVLGMLRDAQDGVPVRPVVKDAPQRFYVSEVLPKLTDAIGAAARRLEEHKANG